MPRHGPPVWVPLLACAALRLFLGSIARSAGLWGDEGAYLRHAHAFAETGVYVGHWPPLYVWFLGACVRWFGDHGEGAARLLQVALSVWTCAWVQRLAARSFGPRSASWAAWIFALYLPLATLSHRLLSETVYLALLVPAVAILVDVLAGRIRPGWAALSGVLLGFAVLTRDVGLPTLIASALVVPFALPPRSRGRMTRGLLIASGLVLWAAVAVAPWGMARAQLRGSFLASGGTALANLRQGLVPGFDSFEIRRLGPDVHGSPDGVRMRLLRPPHSDAVQRARGGSSAELLALVHAEPAYFARMRLVRWADLITPLNPTLTAWYSRVYGRDGVPSLLRRTLIVAATLSPIALTIAALFALMRVRAPRSLWVPILAVLVVTAGTALLVALSRFRAPAVPFLIVLVSGLACADPVPPRGRARFALGLGLLVLGGWIVAFPPLEAALVQSW